MIAFASGRKETGAGQEYYWLINLHYFNDMRVSKLGPQPHHDNLSANWYSTLFKRVHRAQATQKIKEEKSMTRQPQLTAHQMPAHNIQFWSFELFSTIHSRLVSQLLGTVLSTLPLYLLCCLGRLEGWRG